MSKLSETKRILQVKHDLSPGLFAFAYPNSINLTCKRYDLYYIWHVGWTTNQHFTCNTLVIHLTLEQFFVSKVQLQLDQNGSLRLGSTFQTQRSIIRIFALATLQKTLQNCFLLRSHMRWLWLVPWLAMMSYATSDWLKSVLFSICKRALVSIRFKLT